MFRKNLLLLLAMATLFVSCGSFKAERVNADEADELAMEITDKWVDRDTEIAVKQIIEDIHKHKGFKRYLAKRGGNPPKLFIAEVQNATSEPYFPIDDFNDEMLNEFSSSGDFILIDAAAREKLLKEIQYQNDGMVDPAQAKSIGKQAGADLLIFGAVRMQPKSRAGKTIKNYSVNIRMTDIEKGIEVFRARVKVHKASDQKSTGW